MARDGMSRDMGPTFDRPPSSTGNIQGTKDAWDDNSPLGKASDAGLEEGLSREEGRGPGHNP